jgi:hypothetical protein
MTEEKFVAYFYGASTDDVNLAEAMQRARCTYGIHLDMNAGHTGSSSTARARRARSARSAAPSSAAGRRRATCSTCPAGASGGGGCSATWG